MNLQVFKRHDQTRSTDLPISRRSQSSSATMWSMVDIYKYMSQRKLARTRRSPRVSDSSRTSLFTTPRPAVVWTALYLFHSSTPLCWIVFFSKDALARDKSVLVFCSTKKWCQQTATLLAKEVLSDRNRAAVRAAAVATPAAGGESSYVNRDSSRIVGGSKGKAAGLTGFVPAKSMVLAATAAAGAAVESTKSPHPRAREGTAAEQGTGATATTVQEGRSATERRRGASSPKAADDVREKLRQTPVGLDADLSYLVRLLPFAMLNCG